LAEDRYFISIDNRSEIRKGRLISDDGKVIYIPNNYFPDYRIVDKAYDVD